MASIEVSGPSLARDEEVCRNHGHLYGEMGYRGREVWVAQSLPKVLAGEVTNDE